MNDTTDKGFYGIPEKGAKHSLINWVRAFDSALRWSWRGFWLGVGMGAFAFLFTMVMTISTAVGQ